MSSELTIDIQLTELGFSNRDFQILGEKKKHVTTELLPDTPSSSSSSSSSGPSPVETYVDVCSDSPNDPDSELGLSSEESSKMSIGESDKGVQNKRRENVNEAKEHKGQKSIKRKLMSDTDAYEEEDEDEDESDVLSSDTNDLDENQCPVCRLSFTSASLLHEHLPEHNDVRLYSCAKCGKNFCYFLNYRTHLCSNEPVKPFQCIICRSLFTTQEQLQQHLDTNHLEDQFYQCDFCKRIFTSMEECKRHVRTHQRHWKRHPCPKCERSFRHSNALMYHLRQHKKDVFVCKDCGMTFSKKLALLRHSFKHSDLLPYTCSRCKRHFQFLKAYNNHECKSEELQCIACLVTFQNKDDFENHRKSTGCWGYQTAASEKTNDLRCMECGKVFDNSEELKKHAGTHQRVMRCSECGMGFRSSIMLMSHMGGHAAQRPCLCKECGLGFCHQQAYDSHLKTCGLVTPALAATKKPKAVSKPEPTEPASTSQKTNYPDKTSDTPQLPPDSSGASQTKPGSPSTLPLNKKPVRLFVFLPSSSSSSQKSSPDPQNRVSSATHASEIPLSPTSAEPKKTVLVQNNASSTSGTKLLIPLTTKNVSKFKWTVLDLPTSGSILKTYTTNNDKSTNANSKPTSHNPQDTTENKDQNLPSTVTEASVVPETPLSSVKVRTEGPVEQGRSSLHDLNPSVKMSDDALLMMNVETKGFGAGKTHKRDFGSSENKPDISWIKKEPEQWDEDPKSYIRLVPELSAVKMEQSFIDNMMQKTLKLPKDEDVGCNSTGKERFEREDDVQCETCGKMLSKLNFVQHLKEH